VSDEAASRLLTKYSFSGFMARGQATMSVADGGVLQWQNVYNCTSTA